MGKYILDNVVNTNKSAPKVIYNLGADAGFFSEYNNMILFLVYCLDKGFRFSLYSKSANFKIGKGWEDFFMPFCDEDNNIFHSFVNKRPYKRYRFSLLNFLYRLLKRILRRMLPNCLLMSDVWDEVRSMDLNKQYSFPSLGISGNLRMVCQELINLTWVYTEEMKRKSDLLKQTLNLPSNYIGLHIRGGDKFIEAKTQEIDVYMAKAISLTDCKNAFVLTDDYSIIEDLKLRYKDWTFYTLCNSSERGYFHQQFKRQNVGDKENNLIKLFASIDLIAESELFIGTFSSNPGMYLGMRMNPSKTFSVDIPEWVIW